MPGTSCLLLKTSCQVVIGAHLVGPSLRYSFFLLKAIERVTDIMNEFPEGGKRKNCLEVPEPEETVHDANVSCDGICQRRKVGELVDDRLLGGPVLMDESTDSDHCKASVLDL